MEARLPRGALLAALALGLGLGLIVTGEGPLGAIARGGRPGDEARAGAPSAGAPVATPRQGDPAELPWLLLGPFGNPAPAFDGLEPIDRDWLASRGGEAGADPGPIQGLGEGSWEALGEHEGRLALHGAPRPSALGEGGPYPPPAAGNPPPEPRRPGLYYAFRRLPAGPARSLELRIASSSPLKLFLDGRPVYARYDREGGEALESLILDLEGGEGRLLLKFELDPGEEGPSLSFGPAAEAASGQEAGPAGRRPGSYALRPFARVLAPGEGLEGVLVSRSGPSFPPALPLELRSPGGELLSRGESGQGGAFSLPLPPSYRGPLELLAPGCDRVGLFVGELGPALKAASTRARTALAESGSQAGAGPAPSLGPAGASPPYDRRASLSFLLELFEGGAPGPTQNLEALLLGLGELESLIDGGALGAGRVWLLARPSPLDGEPLPYILRPGDQGPLLIALHDRGEDPLLALRRLEAHAPAAAPLLAPFGGAAASYRGPWEELLSAELAAVGPGAEAGGRPILLGWGRGASAAFGLALRRPESFGALLSFGGRPWTADLGALTGLPLLLGAGREDPELPPSLLRAEAGRLLGSGALVDLANPEGSSPAEAFEAWAAGGALPAWLGAADARAAALAAKPQPQTGSLLAPSPRGARLGPLAMGAFLDPSRPASLSYERLDERHLRVDTENLGALSLDLSGPAFPAGGSLVAAIDGSSILLDAGGRVELRRGEDGAFAVAGEAGPADEALAPPFPSSGEGFAALLRGPLSIVYGTKAGAARNRALAEALAAELGSFASLSSWPRVLSDREALPPEAASVPEGGILFVGGPGENRALDSRLLPPALERSRGGLAFAGEELGPAYALLFPYGAGTGGGAGRLAAILELPFPDFTARRLAGELFAPLLRPGSHAGPETVFRTPDLLLWSEAGRSLLEASIDADYKRAFPWVRTSASSRQGRP